ncbi:TetR/AcrR family transcriptional regulator [Embleya sp. NBC_00888]|uniref:TetR/AcrR family transcriptional regulator n=1 Tax=Embleya sp. NBC_00888 TaxID=2975960 RepID=UPI00386A39BE|nr:TetR/AcrR family transcriptional regulator [Embleya sp. NBC_00888]
MTTEQPPARAMRADARRNYERLIVAAGEAFSEHGPDAPLDDIVRRAGVSPGTLYRNFPTRHALLEAVFHDGVEGLCSEAQALLGAPVPEEALATWLRSVIAYATTYRGLAASLMATMLEQESTASSCHTRMRSAGAALLLRAQQAGTVRKDTDISDLLKIANGIAWAIEQAPSDAGQTDRLLELTMGGLRTAEATPARAG